MPGQLLPLFPLPLVLFPETVVPLHIFEERYKTMMSELIPGTREFGIVLAKDQGIANIGCAAVVQRVLRTYGDGRMDLVALGRRRFHILNLDDEMPYLRAEIESFEDADDTPAPPSLREQTLEAFEKLSGSETPEEVKQNALLSFQVADAINDVDKRQAVLSIRSEVDRLRFLIAVLPQYTAEQSRINEAKRLAPMNGHAKHVHSES